MDILVEKLEESLQKDEMAILDMLFDNIFKQETESIVDEIGLLEDYYFEFISELNDIIDKEKQLDLSMYIPTFYISEGLYKALKEQITPQTINECMNVMKYRNFLHCILSKIKVNDPFDRKLLDSLLSAMESKVLHFVNGELI